MLTRPHASPARTAPHAAIVGAGFGGLAAGVRLAARGYRVTVLEKLEQAGGRAAVFRQDGFTFDAGPTIITAPFLFEELWALAGRRMSDDVALFALDPMYTLRFDDGETFDAYADAERMRAAVGKLSPGDVGGYERYMAMSAEIFRVGFQQLGHTPFSSPLDMARVAPDLVRLCGHRSVHWLVSRYVKSEKLRIALGFHPLFVGGDPFSASAVYGLISHLERHWGVHYAAGGTNRLVAGIVDLIEGMGGAVRLNAGVSEILVENGRAVGVQLESGERVAADVVVSNADSAATYKHLVPAHARRRWTDSKLDAARYSMSLFVWHFGTRRTFPDVPHHTIVLGPRYRDLIADIFGRKRLAPDMSLYLHRPTASDPSLAPPGSDSFYVLSPVPHLDSGIDWEVEAPRYRAAVAKRLEETVLPGFTPEIVTEKITTPLTFRDRLSSLKGAAFGLEPILTQSAWFRPNNRSEDVERLFLVGAGTHPGGGLPGVLSSARVLDAVVPDPAALVDA